MRLNIRWMCFEHTQEYTAVRIGLLFHGLTVVSNRLSFTDGLHTVSRFSFHVPRLPACDLSWRDYFRHTRTSYSYGYNEAGCILVDVYFVLRTAVRDNHNTCFHIGVHNRRCSITSERTIFLRNSRTADVRSRSNSTTTVICIQHLLMHACGNNGLSNICFLLSVWWWERIGDNFYPYPYYYTKYTTNTKYFFFTAICTWLPCTAVYSFGKNERVAFSSFSYPLPSFLPSFFFLFFSYRLPLSRCRCFIFRLVFSSSFGDGLPGISHSELELYQFGHPVERLLWTNENGNAR